MYMYMYMYIVYLLFLCTLQRMQPILYSLLLLGSVSSDCIVFYGDIIFNLSTAIMVQIIL